MSLYDPAGLPAPRAPFPHEPDEPSDAAADAPVRSGSAALLVNAMRVGIVAAAALGLLATGIASAKAAGTADVRASYRVSYGGLPVGRLDSRVAVSGDTYALDASFESGGVASLMGSTSGTASAAGAIGGAGPVPDRFAFSYRSGDKTRSRRVAFRGGDVSEAVEEPARPAREDFVSPGADDLRDVRDPASAFIVPAPGGEPCRGTLRVFDGRTRIDMGLRPLDTVPFRAEGFRGDVRRCGVRPKAISGYRKGKRTDERMAELRGVRASFVAVPGTDLAMLVALEVPTSIGTFRAKATRIDFGG